MPHLFSFALPRATIIVRAAAQNKVTAPLHYTSDRLGIFVVIFERDGRLLDWS